MVICELRNKSDVLMKQGDMKKLRSQLEEFWKHPEGLEIFFAPKTSLHIRRFTSRDKTIVTAYSNDANVLVFSVNELWIPSLQTVWDLKLTSLLTFEVPNNVLHILKRGADLMAPGVCNYESLDRFNSRDICLISVAGDGVPLAVGYTLMNSLELSTNNYKGKLVRILHIVDDEMFKLSRNKVKPERDQFFEKQKQETSLAEEFLGIQIGDGDDNQENGVENSEPTAKVNNNEEEGNRGSNAEQDAEKQKPRVLDSALVLEEVSVVWSQEELLEYCLLCGLKKAKKALPILCSTFQSQFLVPSCPRGFTVNVKKSRFRKMGNFFKEYEMMKLLTMEVDDRDVWKITSVDFSHDCFREKCNIKRADEETPSNEKPQQEDEVRRNFQNFEDYEFPEIRTLYFANKSFSALFGNVEKGNAFSAAEIRDLVKKYILENCKIESNLVCLDPNLAAVVLKKNENQTHLSWQEIYNRVFNDLPTGYIVEGKSMFQPCIVKGLEYPVLDISTQKRAGNKHVTVIQNLEKFQIDLKEFARYLQHAAASSSSVSQNQANKADVVIVQGNQIKLLRKIFLEKLKFPFKYVNIPTK